MLSVDESFETWRQKHPGLHYSTSLHSRKRWFRPPGPEEYMSQQVEYGTIMDSISEHVIEVEGEADPLKIRGFSRSPSSSVQGGRREYVCKEHRR